MMIRVRLFARAKDIAGVESLAVELPSEATAADLRRGLASACPALTGLLARSALVIDNEFARDEQRIAERSEFALLPPVSGGQDE
jgi:molybdopterin converting factor small subunit